MPLASLASFSQSLATFGFSDWEPRFFSLRIAYLRMALSFPELQPQEVQAEEAAPAGEDEEKIVTIWAGLVVSRVS